MVIVLSIIMILISLWLRLFFGLIRCIVSVIRLLVMVMIIVVSSMWFGLVVCISMMFSVV